MSEKPHSSGQIEPGDTSKRVGMESLRECGLGPEERREKLLDAIGYHRNRISTRPVSI